MHSAVAILPCSQFSLCWCFMLYNTELSFSSFYLITAQPVTSKPPLFPVVFNESVLHCGQLTSYSVNTQSDFEA